MKMPAIFMDSDARCSVRVFERYSAMGGNRVSLNITLFQNGNGPVKLSAIYIRRKSGDVIQNQYLWRISILDRLSEILD